MTDRTTLLASETRRDPASSRVSSPAEGSPCGHLLGRLFSSLLLAPRDLDSLNPYSVLRLRGGK